MRIWIGVLLLVGLGCNTTPKRLPFSYARAIEASERQGFQVDLFKKACDEERNTAACVAAGQLALQARPRTLSILQGLTSDSATQLSIVVPKGRSIRFYLWDQISNKVLQPVRQAELTRDHSEWAVVKLAYDRLSLGHAYRLDAVDEDDRLLDSRELKTLKTFADEVKFAVASCMNDLYKKEQGPMWQSLLGQSPELLFLIGDNAYVDTGLPPKTPATPPYIWKRYVETRQNLDLYKAATLVPTLAVWDDHDMGMDDADRSFPYKAESKEIFQTFFAQEPDGKLLVEGPGLAAKLQAFHQNFFLLDVRSFRTPASAPREEQSHLGPEQTDWCVQGLEGAPTFLMQGDQFFGAYHPFESSEGRHPEDFKMFLARVKKAKSPVFFVSGDRHNTELMKIESKVLGYPTYELTTSGIHAYLFPANWRERPNPRQVTGVENRFNFAIIKTAVKPRAWDIHVQVMGVDSSVLYARDLKVNKEGAK